MRNFFNGIIRSASNFIFWRAFYMFFCFLIYVVLMSFSNCVSTGLDKECTRYEEKEYEYRNFTRISEIHNGQQDGYVVRFTFYAIADRDAHIIFTTNDHPNFRTDNVYEICKKTLAVLNKTHSINLKHLFSLSGSNRRLGQSTNVNKTQAAR